MQGNGSGIQGWHAFARNLLPLRMLLLRNNRGMHLPRSEGYSQELSACRSRMRRRAIESDSEGAWPSTVSIIRDDRAAKRKRLGFLLLPPRIEFEIFGRLMGLAEIWVLEVGSIVILHTAAAFILVQCK